MNGGSLKLYICCDLEGVAGVFSHPLQCQWDTQANTYSRYLEQARRLATAELNAAVQGALDGGATEIWAWNGHGSFPGGIDIELLHPECQFVYGPDGGPAGHDESFDAVFMVGQHPMAGAKFGRLAHSFHGGVTAFTVNGQAWGEIAVTAFGFGQLGIPLAMLSGDFAACEEARALAPQVITVPVMRGLTEQPNLFEQAYTVSLAPEKARERIREAAALATEACRRMKPFVVSPPFELSTEFESPAFADYAMDAYDGLTRINETTVGKTSDEFELIL